MTGRSGVRWSRRLFRLVLLLYPSRLRVRAAEEMTDAFEEDVGRARRDGWLELVRLVVFRLPADLVQAHRMVSGSPLPPRSVTSHSRHHTRQVRLAFRSFGRNPGFTLLAVGTIAVGVGSVTAVYAVMETVWLDDLTFPEADRLVALWSVDRATGIRDQFSIPEYMDYAERARTLRAVGAYDVSAVTLTGDDRRPRRLRGSSMSSSLIELLGVRTHLGRTFRPEEDVRGGSAVVLVSHAFWTRELAADSTLSDIVVLDGRPHRVIGVMPLDFVFPDDEIDVWQPLREDYEAFSRRGRYVSMVARMADGVDLSEVRSEVRRIAAALETDMPEYNSGMTVDAGELRVDLVGEAGPVLLLLGTGVVVLLLLASANVSNLLLARAIRREGEFSLRAAIGAGRSQLMVQLLTENLVLFLLGGLAGAAMASGAVEVIRRTGWVTAFRLSSLSVDVGVLVASIAIAAGAGLTFGLIPAWRASSGDLARSLVSRSGAQSRRALSDALVVVQTGLAVVLLTGSVLLTRTVLELERTDPGFEYRTLIKADMWLPSTKYPVSMATYPDWPEIHSFYDRLDRRVRSVPGVGRVAMGSSHPMENRFGRMRFSFEGGVEDGGEQQANIRNVSPGYLDVVGIEIVDGRPIERTDVVGTADVAVVNEAFTRRFTRDTSPLGRTFTVLGRSVEIVGVVEDIRTDGIDVPPAPTIYRPLAQSPSELVSLLVRTAEADPRPALPALREAIWDVEPDVPLDGLETLASVRSRQLRGPRLRAAVMGAFAVAAGFLAAVGTAGLLAFSVERRRQEIGIRMSLGAPRARVMRGILGRAAALAAAGAVLGVVPTLLAARLAARFIYGVPPTDVVSFLAGPALLFSVALLAAMAPAIRAARIPPADVLG